MTRSRTRATGAVLINGAVTKMNMKRFFYISTLFLLSFVSCKKADVAPEVETLRYLTANVETDVNNLTKTELNGVKIVWSDNDEIMAFDEEGQKYVSKSIELNDAKTVARFGFDPTAPVDNFVYAVYPSDGVDGPAESFDYAIGTSLKNVQEPVAGGFAPNTNLTIALGGTDPLQFHNGCGLLGVTVNDSNISSIKLSMNGTPVSGDCFIQYYDEYGVSCYMDNAGTTYDYVELKKTGEVFSNGSTYYFVVLPGEYSKGLTLTITSSTGESVNLTNSNKLVIGSNEMMRIANLPSLFDDDDDEPSGKTMSVDFENEVSTYSDWTFTNIETRQTNSNVTAHGGSYFGTTGGKTTGSVQTKEKVASPGIITFYISKTSTNTTSSSWKIQTSSDGTSWTDVKTVSASSVTRGEWTEVSQDLSAYSDVYVRVYYDGTTAVRCIDDLTLNTAGGSTPEPTTFTITIASDIINGSVSASHTSAAVGTEITLTATPNDGYEFGSWNVTNASTSDVITVTDNKFTMPAANVTVSATFREKQIPTFASLAELVAAELTSGTEVNVSFENVPIKGIYVTNSGYRNGIYFDIQKGGKDIELYFQNVPTAWVEGGKVSGTLTKCPWKLYSGTWELAPSSGWSWSNLTYAAPVVLAAPAITTQPTDATYVLNESSKNLTVVASGNPSPTYQWYSNTTNSNENGILLEGETNTSYKPGTSAVGTFYYYCVATNSEGTATSNVATITVTEPVIASLPFSFDGGKGEIADTDGMSQTGLGSDYSASPKLKFDDAGDNVIINFNEAAKKVTYTIKGNSTSGTYAFDVMESADGIEYSTVHSHSSISDATSYTDKLAASSRFVKFVYTKKASGNVALGKINISNEEDPTTYTLTINSTTNGSIAATVDGQPVVSGAQIEEGKTVKIVATPSINYEFDAWNVTGATVGTTATETFSMAGNVTVGATFKEKPGEKEFSTTYGYGLSGWNLTNYTDQSNYYQVPSGNDPSVATITDIFKDRTITSNVVITINCATYGSGTNPSDNTFSIYKEAACTNAIKATKGGTLPTSSTYTNVTYTVSLDDAASFVNDLVVKIIKPGKTIRLKSIKVEFKYTE